MGKYMRKGKVNGEVGLTEVVSSAIVGVRTRARTLALQRLQQQQQQEQKQEQQQQQRQNRSSVSSPDESSKSYLELRSRRLEKSFLVTRRKKKDDESNQQEQQHQQQKQEIQDYDEDEQVSLGENVLEAEGRDARETTPCSLIRNPEAIRTPGSSTRRRSSATSNRRPQNSIGRNIPTAQEMEEFFTGAEQLQQRNFVEKYNFDPVNDCPLSGRYEWVKLDS